MRSPKSGRASSSRAHGPWLGGALLACASCGGAPAASSQAPGPSLWPYAGEATQIFDDGIELTAVGYGADANAQPAEDKRLQERTQIADAVLRIRVTGLTARPEGAGWDMALHTLDKLAGKRPPPSDFTLQVGASSPAANVLRSLSTRVSGQTFVVFVEEFARSDGLPGSQLHFHLAQDTPDELISIREAAALGDSGH
jgi:hypothetical protein